MRGQVEEHAEPATNGQHAIGSGVKALDGHLSSKAASLASNMNGSTNGTSTETPLALQVQRRNISGSFFGHNREEVARILIQGLQDLGYEQSATALSKESGYSLETKSAASFRAAIIAGDWAAAEGLLISSVNTNGFLTGTAPSNGTHQTNGHEAPAKTKVPLASDADVDEMLFLIRQQKYLELLENEDTVGALKVLRQELRPLRQDHRQLHVLSSLIMCQSVDDLKAQAGWDGAAGESRKLLLSDLSKSISPAAMIPEHRLAELLLQVKDKQIKACEYHNAEEWPSLYTDHECEAMDFPLDCIAEMTDHTDEVWVLQFSHDGTRLATAGSESVAVIWDMTTFQPVHHLTGHHDSITYVSWSPDDKKLITCSRDRQARIFDTENRRCLHTLSSFSEPVTTAAFAPDGRTFVLGSMDKSNPLCIWDAATLSNKPLHSFNHCDFRVRDCALAALRPPYSSLAAYTRTTGDDQSTNEQIRLVVADTINAIHVFDYRTKECLRSISVNTEITCLSLSGDGQEMLFNLSSSEVWTMGTEDGLIRRKYAGQKQGEFVVRSCFGGATEGFVVSGGEDSYINVWHRDSGKSVGRFESHAGEKQGCCINAVAWNHRRPSIWASVGDDKKVRIYGPSSTYNLATSGSSLLRSKLSIPQQWTPETPVTSSPTPSRPLFGSSHRDDPDWDPVA